MKAFICFILLQTAFGRPTRAAEAPAVIVVAVPANADATIVEALHRLRGEASAVGFEVRLVSSDRMSDAQLEELRAASHAAAVVTMALPEGATTRSLDVTFAARPGASEISIAHIAADDVTDKQRGDVVLAVRAVDFIRARMFDTLVDRGVETRRAEADHTEEPVVPARRNRFHLSGGSLLLGSAPHFGPSITPRIGIGYLPWSWLRARAVAFGLGSKPTRESTMGQVSLDPRFVGAELTLLTRHWWRLKPVLSLSGGEYWVDLRGEAKSANIVGQLVTRSTPAASISLGLAFAVGHGLSCELVAGTLLLQRRVHIATETEDLGTLGDQTAFAGLMVNADF